MSETSPVPSNALQSLIHLAENRAISLIRLQFNPQIQSRIIRPPIPHMSIYRRSPRIGMSQ
jgi:hypothetical protein